MKKTFVALAFLAVLAGLLLLVPFLVPLDRFIPEIESAARGTLGVPVRVASFRLYLLPTPHATAGGIEIGAGDLRLGQVSAYPELGSLLSEPRAIRLIEIDELFVRDSLFATLKMPKQQKDEKPAVEIRRVDILNLKPEIKGKQIGVWRARAELGGNFAVQRAEVSSEDGKFSANLASSGEAWEVEVSAKDWQLPVGPPLRFSSLSIKGTVTGKLMNLPEIKAALYGGTLRGNARAEYPARWAVSGNFAADKIDVGPLAKVFTPRQSLGGRLKTDGRFSARAARPEGLADALGVDGRFELSEGVLYGFDLANAAKALVTGGSKGGETRFDRFQGDYQVAGRNVKLRNLHVASGVLEAKGKVDIAGGSKLAGSVDVDLKNTKGLVGVPIALSGTVQDPTLTPTRGSAIGAAVGTVLLPGIGTSLGASVGRFFEKKTGN